MDNRLKWELLNHEILNHLQYLIEDILCLIEERKLISDILEMSEGRNLKGYIVTLDIEKHLIL